MEKGRLQMRSMSLTGTALVVATTSSKSDHIVTSASRIPVRRPPTPSTDAPAAIESRPVPSDVPLTVEPETTNEARLWTTIDGLTSELEAVAAVATARAAVHAAQMHAAETQLAATTAALDRLRSGVYDTVAACFLHELHTGETDALSECMAQATAGDDAALAWIQACFGRRLLHARRHLAPDKVPDTAVLYMESAVRVLAGIVPEDEDTMPLPTLSLETPSIASMASRRYQPTFVDRSAPLRRCLRTVFERLGAHSQTLKVVLVHPPLWTASERDRVSHLLWHEFYVPALLLTTTAEVILRAAGLSSGVVVDVGPYTTTIVPIYNDRIVTHATLTLPGGRDMVLHATWGALREHGAFGAVADEEDQFDAAEQLLRTHGFVAYDVAAERAKRPTDVHMTWRHESRLITSSAALFEGPEQLFHPSRDDGKSLQEAVLSAIDRCNPVVRAELAAAIVLNGALTTLPGFKRRLTRELILLRHDLLGQLRLHDGHGFVGACTLARFAHDDVWIVR
ncbi:hypothetical protein SPRG_02280 [Saprolegnia parasitica CBS 223.65]|uniref:Actin n=1 Tax=Saprolegnia parasitica (strain CBS 223.65) TaxID=695850 RepID=A0A067D359_SAPPC|nr:hypothetical protein SPRG_02280 [Saprolegnia parasitica CBS 223.65]KDO33472.1 hypothetical protein SPRG_02280 [Saprolegnia parasitica CBS 223.65]|eukprot:XP_012196216.1 hypothetical protein SPRG_02280 [Saprolegnia parasitica CBS 223.65]